jgi:hypothetical protein
LSCSSGNENFVVSSPHHIYLCWIAPLRGRLRDPVLFRQHQAHLTGPCNLGLTSLTHSRPTRDRHKAPPAQWRRSWPLLRPRLPMRPSHRHNCLTVSTMSAVRRAIQPPLMHRPRRTRSNPSPGPGAPCAGPQVPPRRPRALGGCALSSWVPRCCLQPPPKPPTSPHISRRQNLKELQMRRMRCRQTRKT